jgi:radical SAM superfamily enzyme YgiQ (UPF0313 family)
VTPPPMRVDLLFPPVHDPSMPHLALPLLKSSLKRAGFEAVCHDLNREFFVDSATMGEWVNIRDRSRSEWAAATSVDHGLEAAGNFTQRLTSEFRKWESVNEDFRLTFRYLGGVYNRRRIADVCSCAELDGTPFDDVLRRRLDTFGSVVGINISVEDQILPAFRYASLLRRERGDVKIVLGGNIVTRLHPFLHGDLGRYWDYIVVREGESALVELLGHLQNDSIELRDQRIISPSGFSSMPLGKPFFTTEITDISELPAPDFSDYPVEDYLSLEPILPILMGRRCYWGKCRFCTIHEGWDPTVRFRSVDDVAAEVRERVSGLGVRRFRFVDEAAEPRHLAELSTKIADLGITFEVYAIAEKRFLDEEFVQGLSSAGCRQIYFGLESADEAALKSMGKTINQYKRYGELFDSCARSGIHVYAYSLFGFPGDSLEGQARTIDFLKRTRTVHCAIVGSFIPVVGSRFAMEDPELVAVTGGMTEDLMLMGPADAASRPADLALREIFEARPDLALSASLNDEIRFLMASRFGSAFAQVATEGVAVDTVIGEGVRVMRRERIARHL